MYPVSQQYTPYRTGVGAVEINIYNPTASGGGAMPVCPNPPATTTNPNNGQQTPAQNLNPPTSQQPQQPVAQQPINQQPETKKDDAKKAEEQKPIVPLTDNYIKSVENYLNSPNADIRLVGVKEVLKRFKEDQSRKTDPALTNLMNKALQDPSQGVRIMALTILDADYATGDELTYKILQNMQKSPAAYNQDAVTAANILIKKAGQNLNVESTVNSAQPVNTQPQTGQNLNVQSTANSAQPVNTQPQTGQNLNVVTG